MAPINRKVWLKQKHLQKPPEPSYLDIWLTQLSW